MTLRARTAAAAVLLLLHLPAARTAAQGAASPRAGLLLVVPETDTTTTTTAAYRLSGSTRPGCSVTLNGKALRVFPSGAFAGLLDLQPGQNSFLLEARSGAGESWSKGFWIFRAPARASIPADSLAFSALMLEPAQDLWLMEGDLLRAQCMATPGCSVSFLGGVPMTELSAEETGGLRGVYRGIHRVTAAETLAGQPVRFVLQDTAGRLITCDSPGRVWCRTADFPRVGIARGERPALRFGLGEDRLGGAVLSFIAPGVRLAITGKIGRQYRVALAPDREAWIGEHAVDLQPPGTYPPFSLTGSWSVYGDDRFDYVILGLTDRLPYATFPESDPARIAVEVYGAVSNTNWITQQLTTKEIRNVSYSQPGRNIFRFTVELRHRQIWGYDLSYRGTSLVLRVRRQPEKLKIKALSFVLDAGHGGESDGAIGSTGAKEKEINLATVLHLKTLLEERGARVVLTRSIDTTLGMNERVRAAVDSGADILISVHANSIGNTSDPLLVRGVSTYYKHLCYRPLSLALYGPLLKMGLAPFGNVGSFNFTLNAPTELPNALVELAFMSHPEDEMLLLDDDFRTKAAEAIVDGIEGFLDGCDD